jgi:hypothetical protein
LDRALNHERVVKLLGAVLSPPLLVTEFAPYGSLYSVLRYITTALKQLAS